MIYGLFLCIILSIFLFPFCSQPASQPYSLSLSLWLNRYLFRHFSRSIVFSSFPYSRNYKQDDSMIRWEIKLDRISFSDCTSLSFTYNEINFYNHIMIMIYNILVFSYRSKRKQIENCSMPNRISMPAEYFFFSSYGSEEAFWVRCSSLNAANNVYLRLWVRVNVCIVWKHFVGKGSKRKQFSS